MLNCCYHLLLVQYAWFEHVLVTPFTMCTVQCSDMHLSWLPFHFERQIVHVHKGNGSQNGGSGRRPLCGGLFHVVYSKGSLLELPFLSDSAESALKINQSFYVLMNKFENLPGYWNLFPIMLNVILNISQIVVHVPNCNMQILPALQFRFYPTNTQARARILH